MKHIFLFVIFTLLSIIITSEMVNAQNIKFIEKGLSILPMGEKLNDSVKLDLKSISTSTLKEKMEHSLVFGLQDSLYYENISGNEKYLIDEKNFKNMYVGYTKDEIVKKIFIK